MILGRCTWKLLVWSHTFLTLSRVMLNLSESETRTPSWSCAQKNKGCRVNRSGQWELCISWTDKCTTTVEWWLLLNLFPFFFANNKSKWTSVERWLLLTSFHIFFFKQEMQMEVAKSTQIKQERTTIYGLTYNKCIRSTILCLQGVQPPKRVGQ